MHEPSARTGAHACVMWVVSVCVSLGVCSKCVAVCGTVSAPVAGFVSEQVNEFMADCWHLCLWGV